VTKNPKLDNRIFIALINKLWSTDYISQQLKNVSDENQLAARFLPIQ